MKMQIRCHIKPLIIGVITCCAAMMTMPVYSASSDPFVPADFQVPEEFENERFRIRQLTANDAEKDYEAVMSSLDHLQDMFLAEWEWPPGDLTMGDEKIDLGKEEKRFRNRTSFAYTVVTLDESQVLGSVYFYPTGKGGYDADITMWVRKSAFDEGLDPILFDSVKQWVSEEWPFKNAGYPGREISWEKWNSLE